MRIANAIINSLESIDFSTDPKQGELEFRDGGNVVFVIYDVIKREIDINIYDEFGDFIESVDASEFLNYLPEPKEYMHEIDVCNFLLTNKL